MSDKPVLINSRGERIDVDELLSRHWRIDKQIQSRYLPLGKKPHVGTTADGERMVQPLRDVAPAVLDTVRDMPYIEVASIHNEPTDPVPYYERGIMLREFPAQAQDKLIELVGPDSETALVIAELRALGGAWDREPAEPNAVATRGLPYSLLAVSAGPLSQEQHSRGRLPSCSTA